MVTKPLLLWFPVWGPPRGGGGMAMSTSIMGFVSLKNGEGTFDSIKILPLLVGGGKRRVEKGP